MPRTDEATNVDLVEGFDALRKDVAALVATVSQMANDQARSAGARVSGAVDGAAEKITEATASAKSVARAASCEIEAGIEKNPLTALLIAFGVGLSVAVLTRSRG